MYNNNKYLKKIKQIGGQLVKGSYVKHEDYPDEIYKVIYKKIIGSTRTWFNGKIPVYKYNLLNIKLYDNLNDESENKLIELELAEKNKAELILFQNQKWIRNTMSESLIYLKPMYYYFLDGYLNENSGSNLSIIQNMFIKYKNLFNPNIKILFNDFNDNNLKFYTSYGKTYILDFSAINQHNFKNSIFKYCIYHIACDSHALSILFRINDNKLYVECFNSGIGISQFSEELKARHNDEYYLPSIPYILSDNINLNFNELINKIKGIINISNLYNEIKENKLLFSKKKLDNKYVQSILMLFNLLNKSLNFENVGFNVLIENKNIFDNINDNYENTKIDTSNLKSYYEIIMNLFKNNLVKVKIIIKPNFNIINLLDFNDNIKNNIILHYFNGRLYIRPQQSGSCTWFSIYWPILFYDVYNDDIENYKETLLKIYNFFMIKLKEIFTNENFKKESKNYLIMKVLCNKFIDLKLLQNNVILNHEIDFIYERPIDIDSFSNSNIITNKYNINYINLFNNLPVYFLKLKDTDKKNLVSLIYIYNIYKYGLYIKIELFKSNDIKVILTTLNKIKDSKDSKINEIKNYIIKYNNSFTNNIHLFKYFDTCNYLINLNNDKFINIIDLCNFVYRFNLFINIITVINDKIQIYIYNIMREKNKINIDKYNKELDIMKSIYVLVVNFINKKDSIIPDFFVIEYVCDIEDKRFIYDHYNIITNNFANQTFEDRHEYVEINNYSRSIENYNKYNEFLYENPKYIYQTFNNEIYEIDDCNFIKLHIYNILKTQKYHDNLITFFASKYYELYNTKINVELFWIIANLQILLTMLIGFYNFEKNILNIETKIKKKYKNKLYRHYIYEIYNNKSIKDKYNYQVYKYSSINLIAFSKIIENIYKTHKNSKEEFCEYFINYKEKIVDPFSIIINKHLEGTIIGTDNDRKFIDNTGKKYNIYNSSTDFIIDCFNVYPGGLFLLNDTKDIIIIINYDFYIEIHINNFKIRKIKYNGYEILRYAEISDPFKHVIPTNCVHLIYKINDEYNISYFINNKYEESGEIDDTLLGVSSLKTDVYNISINKNNMMFPNKDSYYFFSELCRNYHINKLNIIYLNDYSLNFINKDATLLCYNNNIHNLYNFNKDKFLKQKLKKINYNKIILIENIKKYSNFQIKISKCINVDYEKILEKFKSYILRHEKLNNSYQLFIKDKNINDLFDNYDKLYEYLLNIKIINSLKILVEILKSKDTNLIINFCSQSKIFNEYFLFKEHQFNYNFEALFELISGNELLKEQMTRYIKIIKDYNIKENYLKKQYLEDSDDIKIDILQTGGKFFPLNHFMMGKGKSAIITPLLSLYFSLKYDKNIIIVIPSHLEKQTHKTMDEYCHIFNITNKVKILNDSTIKKYYLSDVFSNNYNSDTIMLIDEFDSILDPIKSNFNVIIEKSLSINKLYYLFRFSSNLPEKINLENGNINLTIFNDLVINKLIKEEIINTITQIKTNKLIENVNWGIHPKKGYAIPYRSKGNPLLNSNFSSSILTVFLTLYYFIVIKNYEIDEIIVNYIIINNLFFKIFKTIKEPIIITLKYIINLVDIKKKVTKHKLFEIIFEDIFNKILLPSERYNTSFVDILNIPNLFKIGYSGTINIDLPKLKNIDRFDIDHIEKDPDEKDNIEYAILNENTKSYYYKEYIPFIDKDNGINLDEYDALIDTIGLYKSFENEYIANKIYEKYKGRSIIFIDELDNINVIINGHKENYKSTKNYISPFIYYSQAHIVGIDIKQDYYPILKGLCIIDENSFYSQIAQAMFRLRKLNIGHSIDFLNKDKERSKEEILCHINENELKLKESKEKYLSFQTLKAEIRCRDLIKHDNNIYENIIKLEKSIILNSRIIYNELYKESVNYYYINYKINENINKIIINFNELDKQNNNYIKIKRDLNNLIYNINSKSIEQDQEQEKEILQNKVDSSLHSVDYNNFNCEYIIYDFKEIKLSLDNLIQNSIEINNDFYCLPNFDTQLDTYNFQNNKIGILFVYIHQKLLIIPGYLLIEFYEYPILDIQFKSINNISIPDYDFERFKLSFLYKILNSEVMYKFNSSITKIEIISYFIIKLSYHYYFNISSTQKMFYDLFNLKFITNEFTDFNSEVEKFKTSKKDLFISKISIDDYKKKYLKYKNKYLNLSKILT